MICSECGKENTSDRSKCWYCGSLLDGSSAPAPESTLITLFCPSCGEKLQIGNDKDRFPCSRCGKELIVQRNGGAISLTAVIGSGREAAVATPPAPSVPISLYEQQRPAAPLPVRDARISGGYEYWDYATTFTGGSAYLSTYTEAGARAKFWQESQSWLMVEITKLMDQGWEPITEVGPAGFTLGYKTTYFDWDAWGWIVYIIFGFMTFGVGFVVMPFISTHKVAFPEEFRVKMRRRRE